MVLAWEGRRFSGGPPLFLAIFLATLFQMTDKLYHVKQLE